MDLLAITRSSVECDIQVLDNGSLDVRFSPSNFDTRFVSSLKRESKISMSVVFKIYRKGSSLVSRWRYSGAYRENRTAAYDPFDDEYIIREEGKPPQRISPDGLFDSLIAPFRTEPFIRRPGRYTIQYRIEIHPFIPKPPLTIFTNIFPIGMFTSGWMRSEIITFGGIK
jgi:hypothetical protein